MTITLALRRLVPLALLALLAACERPHSPPPPKAGPSTAASQAAPSAVALSGTILDPQPNPAIAGPTKRATGASTSSGSVAAARGRTGSTALSTSGAGAERSAQSGADQRALRDFQAEQERRDRELLDQDLSEAQLRARDESGGGLAREDGDWSASDEPPADDEALFDEPPFEEPPYEQEPGFDEGYDPRDGVYRP